MAEWLREVSVGDWYASGGERFEIVGVDTKAEIVLVQYYDGALDEYDFDSWAELEARPCAPPEDLSGALDAQREDFGLEERVSASGESSDPVGWLESHGL
ncbi:MAG: hypothetical protein EPN60_05690 [Nevskiaceae bacterium]|jgi:hypothetical protein|nr:MAG: hypothetical protein EPO48_03390 [Nevskiaceae bacterium]TAM29895.1 MAG: hypothetical protein EPN60_05690 [Nevskiaceae bacterium]